MTADAGRARLTKAREIVRTWWRSLDISEELRDALDDEPPRLIEAVAALLEAERADARQEAEALRSEIGIAGSPPPEGSWMQRLLLAERELAEVRAALGAAQEAARQLAHALRMTGPWHAGCGCDYGSRGERTASPTCAIDVAFETYAALAASRSAR